MLGAEPGTARPLASPWAKPSCARADHICPPPRASHPASLCAPAPATLQVAHYLVLAQLDESLLAHITDNVHTLQPAVDHEVAARAAAAKRSRNERDTT